MAGIAIVRAIVMQEETQWPPTPAQLEGAAILADGSGRITYWNAAAAALIGRRAEDVLGKSLAEVVEGSDLEQRAMLLSQQLSAIVDSSDDVIISKTLDGIITSWNRGAERVLGYTAEEAIGQHVSMIMPPEALEDTKIILSKIRRGEKVDHYISKRRRKDGTIIDVSLTVSPICNAAGEVVGASKVGRDITEARHAGMLKDRLAAIVESSEDIIVSKTLQGVITSWNKGAEKILGYRADEVVGKHSSLLMPPDLVEDTQRILEKIGRGEKVEHYETRRVRKDGGIIDVSLTVSPIRDAEGRIVGASKIGRDISQQKIPMRNAERRNAAKMSFWRCWPMSCAIR
jgi:PAS domain S-box-containing protein